MYTYVYIHINNMGKFNTLMMRSYNIVMLYGANITAYTYNNIYIIIFEHIHNNVTAVGSSIYRSAVELS